MSDIFAEVDEELRAERAKKLLQQYGGLMIAAAVLVIGAAAGWQGWKAWQARENARVAQIFLDAVRAAEASPAETDAALAGFAKAAREGDAGYRSLARLREAALLFDAGKRDEALALWNALAADGAADPLLRDLGTLQWVWHQIDTAAPDTLLPRLAPLTAPGNAWRPLAEEAQALIDLRAGRKAEARDTFRRLAQDPAAPDGVRGRAGAMLAQLEE